MPDRNDWNRQTIEAFRANGGKVGGMWEGRPLLLLTTTGAKSGRRRTHLMIRSPRPTGRARIGSRSRKRCRSSANSSAVG